MTRDRNYSAVTCATLGRGPGLRNRRIDSCSSRHGTNGRKATIWSRILDSDAHGLKRFEMRWLPADQKASAYAKSIIGRSSISVIAIPRRHSRRFRRVELRRTLNGDAGLRGGIDTIGPGQYWTLATCGRRGSVDLAGVRKESRVRHGNSSFVWPVLALIRPMDIPVHAAISKCRRRLLTCQNL